MIALTTFELFEFGSCIRIHRGGRVMPRNLHRSYSVSGRFGHALSFCILGAAAPAVGQCEPAWMNVGEGTGAFTSALTVFDDGSGPALYAGETFTVDGRGISRWDGGEWSGVGGGMNEAVNTLVEFDDGTGPALYAGGFFSMAGDVSASRIAKWDGESWSPLGEGMGETFESIVETLAVFDDGEGSALYAGGFFETAGGVIVNNIAKWDGSSWSELGGGVDFRASAMAVFDDGTGPALFVGGEFETAGGRSARNIAKWDGQSWSSVGDGVDGAIRALTVFDDGSGPALYAGGFFTVASGVWASRIAKWDGAAWSALGDGMGNYYVVSLMGFDDGSGPGLYAGGFFTMAGGQDTLFIAQWDGADWSPLGSGTNGTVDALTVFDDGSGPGLYVAGSFRMAGDVDAFNVARWSCDGSSCRADINGDGAVNTLDFVFFLNLFNAGDGQADWNEDGAVNTLDFLAFLNDWSVGCE